MNYELKPFWNRYFKFDWKFGLFLLLTVCITRFFWVLKANETGNYGLIGFVMFISAIIPFLFLGTYGRKEIGIKTTKKLNYLALALVIGLIFSVLLYILGQGLYGESYKNWYEYIGKSYNIPENISTEGKRTMFLIMAITGMIFSPIGEELFFRGIVHGSFAKSVGNRTASMIDSSAFALTHISHFGLVFVNQNWDFYLAPALIWVLAMFIASLIFFEMKKRTDSILGAILCHSGFNLGMIYCIFYLI